MAFVIEDIFGALASDYTPQYDTDVTVAVRNIGDLQDRLNPDDCPVRMLMVHVGETGGDFAWVALGKLAKANWTITDRLFIDGAQLGENIKQWSNKIIQYSASYAEQVRQNRSPTSQSHILEVRFEPGIFEWPPGSEQYFAGVDCIVNIDEVVSGA